MEGSYPFLVDYPESGFPADYPADYPGIHFSLTMAKVWLDMDIEEYNDRDDLIVEAMEAAVASIETDCNFSLFKRLYQWNTDRLPTEIRDTFYVRSIESISYKGGDTPGLDGYTVIDSSQYELVQISKRKSRIFWENSFKINSNRIRVLFIAGMGEENIPEDIKKAFRARVADEFENRGDGISERRTLSDKLLAPYTIGYAG